MNDTPPTPSPAPNEAASAPAAPAPRRRWLRWLRRGVLGVLLLIAIAIGAAAWSLAHLGHPWVRGVAHDALQQATGLDVRWQAGGVTAHKLSLDGLAVRSAPIDRDLAPLALQVDHIEIPLDLNGLLGGVVRSNGVAIRGVRLTALVDADGGLSLQRLLPPPRTTAPAPRPAKSALQLLDGVPLGSLLKAQIEDVGVTIIQRGLQGGEARRVTIDQLDATLVVDATSQPRSMRLTVRGPGRLGATEGQRRDGPLGLPPLRHVGLPPMPDDAWARRWGKLRRAWQLQLRGQTDISVSNGKSMRVVADISAPLGLPLPSAPTRVAQLEVAVMRVGAERLRASVTRLKMLDASVSLTGSAELSDVHAKTPGPLTQVRARIAGEIAPWLGWLPAPIGAVRARRLGGRLALRAATVSLEAPGDARWHLNGEMGTSRLAAKGPAVASDNKALTALALPLRTAALAEAAVTVTGEVAAERVSLQLGGGAEGLNVALPGASVRWQAATLAKTKLRATADDASAWGWRIDDARTDVRVEGAALQTHAGAVAQRARLTGELHAEARGTPAALHAELSAKLDADAHAATPPMGVTATTAAVACSADLSQRHAHDPTSWQIVRAKGTTTLASLQLLQDGRRVRARDLAGSIEAGTIALRSNIVKVDGLTASAKIERFAGAGLQVNAPVVGSVEMQAVSIPLATPTDTRGQVDLRATAFGNAVSIGLKRKTKALRWQATIAAPRLAEVIAILPMPAATRRMVRWSSLRLSGASSGELADPLNPLTSPIRHDSRLQMTGLDVRHPQLRLSLPRTKLTATGRSAGGTLAQDVTLNFTRPRVGRWRSASALPVTATVRIDPRRPSLHVHGDLRFARGPTWRLTLDAIHRRGDAEVSWEATSTKLKALGDAVPKSLQARVCLDARRLSGSWRGTLRVPLPRRHLLNAAAWQRAVLPIERARLRLRHTLIVRGMRCRQAKLALASPEVKVVATTRIAKGELVLDSHVLLRRLRGHVRDRRVDLRGLDQGLRVQGSLPLDKSELRVELDGRVQRFDQDILPGWPIADARLTGAIIVKKQQFLRLQDVTLTNPKGGTTLRVNGGMDAGRAPKRVTKVARAPKLAPEQKAPGRTAPKRTAPDVAKGAQRADAGGASNHPSRSNRPDRARGPDDDAAAHLLPGRRGFTFTGELVQDMAQLAAASQHVHGKGRVVMPYRVESGDLQVFRLTAKPTFEAVDLALPKWRFSVRGVSGSLPIVEVVDIRDGTLRLLGGGTHNPLARWRFQDQQPFLSDDPYLGLAELRFGEISVGPIAGNARLDRNVFRLDQLEARAMRGQITGQCIVDWEGRNTVVLFRGNGTGLRLLGGEERMDLNAALRFQAGTLALSGQAQLLRTSRSHLLALLDLWDPYRADPRANKLRLLMKVGYPDRIRVVFRHGFADFLVALGGVADVLTIEEIKGIPLGPMMQRWVAPYLPKETR